MSRPWMPLYVADYLVDTAHLDAAESGAYLHLIMSYWVNGSLPKEDQKLARIARMTTKQWNRSKATIKLFFDSEWRHDRIDRELAQVAEISNKRKAAAEQMHAKSKASASANAPTLHTSHSTESKKEPEANASGADAPNDPAIPEREFFARGKEILGKSAGGQLAKLLRVKGGNVALARACLESASQKENPAEYVAGAIRGPPVSARPLTEFQRKQAETNDVRAQLRNIANGGEGGRNPDRFLPVDPGQRSEDLRGGAGSIVLALPRTSGGGGP